jgi:hypothetical protein
VPEPATGELATDRQAGLTCAEGDQIVLGRAPRDADRPLLDATTWVRERIADARTSQVRLPGRR